MAYSWDCDFDPHVQVESRIKGRVLAIIVAVAMIASTGTSFAATTKPTPKPNHKAAVKVTPKVKAKKPAVKKPTVKKPAAKRTTVKKPAAKKTVAKKRTVYKRKVVKLTPLPAPTWPLSKKDGWLANGQVFTRVPNTRDLTGILSASAALALQIKSCTTFACGVVEVASTTGCTWWEIISTVSGPPSATDSSLVPYGTLRTTAKGTGSKQIITVLLVSTEPLKPKVTVGGINISCYHTPVTEKIPTNVYTPNTTTPSPTPSDTSATTPSATPTISTN